jgi:hypothetical protein
MSWKVERHEARKCQKEARRTALADCARGGKNVRINDAQVAVRCPIQGLPPPPPEVSQLREEQKKELEEEGAWPEPQLLD